MSKLLFIYERDMPTVSIMQRIFLHLDEAWGIQSSYIYLSEVTPQDVDSHDIIVLMRPQNVYSWKIGQMARKAGHIVATFCDDDLLNLPSSSPTIPWRNKGLKKALSHSDEIWSSSPYIAEKYKGLTAGKRIAVSDTIIWPEELEIQPAFKDNEIVRIVYAAAPSHASLFDTYIKPIIPELIKEFGDKISFTFVSVHPELQGVQCEYVPGMPLLEYRQYMKKQHFDIGLAPLNTDEFSKCKYFNKFIEYTTQGIVGVYTDTEPYNYVVINKSNGFLTKNDQQSWLSTLAEAIRDSQLRKECLRNAIQYLKNNHSEQACIERLCKGIPEIKEPKGSYCKCAGFGMTKIVYYISRPLDWFYLAGFYVKQKGIKEVINRIKTHITPHAYSKQG